MSGHSKWSTIKRQKGVNDAKRGQTFTKIANAISISARLGGSGDPNDNPRLRMVLDQARSVNLPKENIQRAIDRGLGKLPGQVLEEAVYEGFGPGKVAFIVEVFTDNRMRTTQEIRNIFERAGGSMGSPGVTAYMFNKMGLIQVSTKGGPSDEEILELIDTGAEDVEEYDDEGIKKYLIYVPHTELMQSSTKVTQLGYAIDSAQMIYKPTITASPENEEIAQKVINLSERLEENDDVQNVFINLEIKDLVD